MVVQLKVKNNIKQVQREWGKVVSRQIPFITAVALTRTAKDCQSEIIEEIPNKFNVTKKWWLPRQPTGIKIIPAKKHSLTSWVYTRAYFASLQEHGGTKTPFSGRSILVPDKRAPKYAKRAGGHRKIFNSPKTLHHKNSPFIDTGKGVKVLQRVGKGRYPLKPVYHVVSTAQIRERFDFRKIARRQAEQSFEKAFIKAGLRYRVFR